jgi:mRNA-degrading endonuclease RelE of RelBE toxin-antitoxin system
VNGWKVELSPTAQREFRQLAEGPKRDAEEVIEDLREQGPALVQAVQLRGYPDLWRVRFHETYRMVYQVSRSRKHIFVTRMRPRRIAYKGMRH